MGALLLRVLVPHGVGGRGGRLCLGEEPLKPGNLRLEACLYANLRTVAEDVPGMADIGCGVTGVALLFGTGLDLGGAPRDLLQHREDIPEGDA